MKFRARKRLRFGPLQANVTERGLSSWSIRIWRFTYNLRTRRWSFDTPGPGSVSGKRRR
jgi:hypothetical protein